MKVKITDGDGTREMPVEEAVDSLVLGSGAVGHHANVQRDIAAGDLEDEVSANEDIVSRALEEDVFTARVLIPGWFINQDDELRDHYGGTHDGATVQVDGLVEDYSDKAVRIVAEEQEETPTGHLSYRYAWNFLPKSQVTVIRLTGIETNEDVAEASRRSHAAQLRRSRDWVWMEGEEMPSIDADDHEFVDEEDLPDEEPEFEPGEEVKGRFPQPTGWKEGVVRAVTPRFGGDKWSYHIEHSGHEEGEMDSGAMRIRSLETSQTHERTKPTALSILSEVEDENPEAIPEVAHWMFDTPIEGEWVNTRGNLSNTA